MFSKDHQSIKLLGQSEDKSRVIHEVVNWSLIAGVEEQGTRTTPVGICVIKYDVKNTCNAMTN